MGTTLRSRPRSESGLPEKVTMSFGMPSPVVKLSEASVNRLDGGRGGYTLGAVAIGFVGDKSRAQHSLISLVRFCEASVGGPRVSSARAPLPLSSRDPKSRLLALKNVRESGSRLLVPCLGWFSFTNSLVRQIWTREGTMICG